VFGSAAKTLVSFASVSTTEKEKPNSFASEVDRLDFQIDGVVASAKEGTIGVN
jgi:hypothetical protein